MKPIYFDQQTKWSNASSIQNQKEIPELIEQPQERYIIKKNPVDKSKLLEVSRWSTEDIKPITDAGEAINRWTIKTF